ncbi:hypothetical protein ACFLTC_01855, partial [Chloroflexota bacterium]
GQVPEPGELDEADRALLDKVEAGLETVGALYNACKFRAALGEALALAREANGYTLATLPSAPNVGLELSCVRLASSLSAKGCKRPCQESRRWSVLNAVQSMCLVKSRVLL